MAAGKLMDAFGVCKGLKLVFDSCARNSAIEVKHFANNSSFLPVVDSLSQNCDILNLGKGIIVDKFTGSNGSDADIQFPEFPDESMDGFPLEPDWHKSDKTKNTSNIPSSHTSLHTTSQRHYYHTFSTHATRRYSSDAANSSNTKYTITDNQRVSYSYTKYSGTPL